MARRLTTIELWHAMQAIAQASISQVYLRQSLLTAQRLAMPGHPSTRVDDLECEIQARVAAVRFFEDVIEASHNRRLTADQHALMRGWVANKAAWLDSLHPVLTAERKAG